MFRRRIRISNITFSLIVVQLLLPILSILMFEHITISETLANMDSGAFGKVYEFISVEQDVFSVDKLLDEVGNINKRIAITSDGEVDGEKVRGIYFNKSYINLPMKKGRFFEKRDFVEGNYCAVVGKNMMDKLYEKNRKSYISLAGSEFEVLGIIGYECDTVLDDYIYINGYIQEELFDSSVFLLDFFNEEEIDVLMNNLFDELQSKGITIERLAGGASFMNSFFPRLLYSRWFIIMIFCNVLCMILLSIEWVNYQQQEIGIRRLLGATEGEVIILLGKKYIKNIIFTILVSGAYCIIFHPNYVRFLLTGYLFILPIIFIFLLCITMQVLKAPIEEAIK